MSDHIHVGYRGGAFDANFDGIFREHDPQAEKCCICKQFKSGYCYLIGEFVGYGDWCSAYQAKTRSV